jgi:hypothetical protein
VAKLTSTKFIGAMVGVLGLIAAAFRGKFTGELGLYVSGIYIAYAGGNTLITRKALAAGKTDDRA